MPDSEQATNVKMLAGLRLDAFISGDYQQNQINATHSGQHVAHESLVPRYIHETKSEPLAG